jgi:hypothetical protein
LSDHIEIGHSINEIDRSGEKERSRREGLQKKKRKNEESNEAIPQNRETKKEIKIDIKEITMVIKRSHKPRDNNKDYEIDSRSVSRDFRGLPTYVIKA